MRLEFLLKSLNRKFLMILCSLHLMPGIFDAYILTNRHCDHNLSIDVRVDASFMNLLNFSLRFVLFIIFRHI